MLRKQLSVIILLGFFFALTPRELWHNCEHNHGKIKFDTESKQFKKEDCSICYFDLGTAESPLIYNFSLVKNYIFGNISQNELSFNLYSSGFFHRGPPNIV
jgi:hypothetical protein